MLVITIQNPLATGVGILGNMISICGILAPVPTFLRIYKKKSTESFHSVAYVVALLSAMLWLYYGFLGMDVLLLTINVFSCTIQSAYILIYLTYAPKKAKIFTLKLILLLNVCLFGSIALLSFIFLKGKRRISIVGLLGATFSVSVFAAPLSVIKLVIRTKSVEYMPFLLSFFLTISATVWFTYGLLIRDYFVALPNVLGFTFGMAQIILYFMYMNGKRAASEMKLPEQSNDETPVAVVIVAAAATGTTEPEITGIENKKKIAEPEIEVTENKRNISEQEIKANENAKSIAEISVDGSECIV